MAGSDSSAAGQSIVDVLPNELIAVSLDYLLPHQQLGWAFASKQTLALSNQAIAPLVPFPARVKQSRALEWTFHFKRLSSKRRNILEATAKLSSCPDIFSFDVNIYIWRQRLAMATAMKGQNYLQWRKLLWSTTAGVLGEMAKQEVDLSALNKIGVFHNFSRDRGEEKEYLEASSIRNFVGRGNFPGVWCALGSAANTFSFAHRYNVARITFHSGYKIFDAHNQAHQGMFADWASIAANEAKVNTWDGVVNDAGESLTERVKISLNLAPYHQAFMRENRFAAVLGRTDYSAAVILNADAIASIQWLPAYKLESDSLSLGDDSASITTDSSS